MCFCLLIAVCLRNPPGISNSKKSINKAIQKVYPACVRVYGYDTLRKVQNSAQFSGVVVSPEGHILTVAHAVSPNRIYKVTFPDGKECIAMAQGRIVTEASTMRPDVAMMKILTPGPWPSAELGWSSSLKLGGPCFGISYPESLAQLKPMVRFGTILNTMDEWGFIESGCIMETGDSGGPLFDYMGRVIGLHSRINKPEGANYEVPVDLYRKYWTALNTAKNYSALPAVVDDVKADPLRPQLIEVPHPAQPDKELMNSKAVEGTSVVINSTIRDSLYKINGTIFIKEGLASKKNG